jgi:hypothetical protein
MLGLLRRITGNCTLRAQADWGRQKRLIGFVVQYTAHAQALLAPTENLTNANRED